MRSSIELMLASRRKFAATSGFYLTSKEHEEGSVKTQENKKGSNPGRRRRRSPRAATLKHQTMREAKA